MKVSPKVAFSLATRISHASARLIPPPAAGPLIEATTGLGSSRIFETTFRAMESTRSRDSRSSDFLTLARNLTSAPEQKPEPAPVSTTARTSSDSHSHSAA
jgi:hypothetical protein